MLALISFILAVFPIVIIHEFGHFLVGKYLGAEPEEFSVGFGKSIVNFQWMGANFKIGWIPLGGYVKFKKVQFDVEFGEGNKKGEKIAPWKWFFISVAGPVTNFMLTFAIFFTILFMSLGSLKGGTVTQSTNPEIKVGDKLLTVEEGALSGLIKKTLLSSTSNSNVFISKPGQELTPVKISAQELSEQVVTESKNVVGGLSRLTKSVEISSTLMGLYFTGTTKAITGLFSKEGVRGIMGPVGIAGEAEKARTEGIFSFIFLIASLSFAIGYFNLLPLTFFDGGRAILAVVEQVTKKQITGKLLGNLNIVGLVIVAGLFLAGTTSDIMRLFGK